MEKEHTTLSSHSKEEKQYCKLVLAEIDCQIPAQYTRATMNELKRQGITNLNENYIQRVRNGSKFNRNVVDALKSITKPAKLMHNLSKKMDRHLNNYVR